MRMIVTGGAGFIASHIVDACLAGGHEVLVIDDLSTGRTENLHPSARFEKMDIASPRLAQVFERFRPEVVNHHAAQVSVRLSVHNPVEDGRRNALGTANVLECARLHGVSHVIYASSGGAMYGEPEHLPAGEDTPVAPVSPYGLSKYAGELYGDYYRRMFGLTFTSLRYANVYGPRQDPNGEAGVIAIFTGQMLAGEQPTINGDGSQERDYVYVADVVRANMSALEQRKDGAFNVATGVPTSVNEVFRLLSKLTGYKESARNGPAKAGDAQAVYLDPSRVRTALRWEAQIELPEGLAQTVDFFRSTTLA